VGNVERSMRTLVQLVQSFLDAIVDAINQMPLAFQHLCAHLCACVQERFGAQPNAPLTAVAGFLFLRMC
jgi:hypothetical protein